MLRLVCLSLFASASAFHFGKTLRERSPLGNYNVQLVGYETLPRPRNSLCFPTPFLRQICLPTALQFFMPLRTMGAGEQRCLTLPIMKTYVVKVCPPRQSNPHVANSGTSSRELVKETQTEEEKGRLSDKTNSEVNDGGVEESSKVGNESAQTKNDIIRVFSESEREEEENAFHGEPPFDDENVSITSNLV